LYVQTLKGYDISIGYIGCDSCINIKNYSYGAANIYTYTDIPSNIVWIIIKGSSSSNKYNFNGVSIAKLPKDTLTFFVDTCGTTTSIKTAQAAGYNVYVDGSNYLTVNTGLVSNIEIYNTTGVKVKSEAFVSNTYVGDLNTGVYIALIEVDGKQISYKFSR